MRMFGNPEIKHVLASLYPKMELSGLHCDFAALSRFHRQCEHVYFDKAIYPFLFTNWKAAFTDHLAGVAEFVTGTAAELIGVMNGSDTTRLMLGRIEKLRFMMHYPSDCV